MLRAVLMDVGGTLWPDRPTGYLSDEHCLTGLAALLPDIDAAHCLHTLRAALRADEQSLVQDTHALLARALHSLGAECEREQVVAIRRAICAPAIPGIALFPGARELLETIREFGMRCVVLSNVQVRGADEYWRDFADLDIAHLIDAVVTSLDVGFRKPHPLMFQAGLEAAECSPAECVMVGDSELKDIEPARRLGMRAIRVSIEEPPPATTCADATLTSLREVQSILREWANRGQS
jgi:HAD superfamily hydrolase (TIGR01662 family)